LKKLATQFKDYKKRLNLDYIQKNKTPDFTGATEKLKDQWADFVKYRTSETAKKRSAINKINAAKKTYHHCMMSAGYKGVIPRMEKEENDLVDKDVEPETKDWARKAKLWFYGMGGRLDPVTGKCIFTEEQLAAPLAALKTAMNDVKDGKFRPDREKDELSRALGNKEKTGQTRDTEGSVPWKYGFPDSTDTYRSRGRKKKGDDDRLKKLEEIVAGQQKVLESITSQQGTDPYKQLGDPALLDSTGPGSHRKSSVASAELPADDHDAMTEAARYPVDDITQQENCEMHVKFMNISVKVADGFALPCKAKGTYHYVPIPDGYAVVGVDEVVKEWEKLELEIPAGEDRELTELGEDKGNTILWRKEHIVLPDWTPRPPTQQSSNPDRSPPPPLCPQPLPSPPARHPSLPP
jgi:hypothetical protein